MVGPSQIIARSFRRVTTQENRAGMEHAAEQPIGIIHHQFGMFRRQRIEQRQRIGQLGDGDDGAEIAPRNAGHGPGGQGFELACNSRFYGVGFGCRSGNQDGLRHRIMFGLGQEVCRDPVRVGPAVGHDHHFRWARHHVDADHAIQLALGFGDKSIAGPGDHVDTRDVRGAKGQRRHRLRAADAEHTAHAGHARRGQHHRVDHTIGGGSHHDQISHAGDNGRDGVHQHRRGIGRPPARHIQAGRINWRPAHTGAHASIVHRIVALRLLAFVEGTDAGGGEIKRSAQLWGQTRQRHIKIDGGNLPASGVQIDAIKLGSEFGHSGIAARFHARDDGGNGGRHIGGIVALGINQRGESRGKTSVACVKPLRHRIFPSDPAWHR